MHVFGLWEEAGVPEREPMQTRGEHANSTQKGPAPAGYQTNDLPDDRRKDLDLNPGPPCCEVTVLTTKPLCSGTVSQYKISHAPKSNQAFFRSTLVTACCPMEIENDLKKSQTKLHLKLAQHAKFPGSRNAGSIISSVNLCPERQQHEDSCAFVYSSKPKRRVIRQLKYMKTGFGRNRWTKHWLAHWCEKCQRKAFQNKNTEQNKNSVLAQ